MISDVVYERIIKKKYEGRDYAKCFLFIFLCIVIPAVVLFAVANFIEGGIYILLSMVGYIILLYVAAIIIAIGLVKNTSYEYEYTFVNGDMTIDKIIAKNKRKRMISFDVKLVEDMGVYDPQKFADNKDITTLVYSDTYAGEGDIYMDFRHPSIGRTVLVIKSDERLEKALKPYIKRHVFKAAFPDA